MESIILTDVVGVLGSSSLIFLKDSQRQVADTYSTPVIYLIGQMCDLVCTLLATSITVVSIQDVYNVVSMEPSQIAKYRENNAGSVGSRSLLFLFLFLSELISVVTNGISTQIDAVTWNEEDYEALEVTLKAVVTVIELGYTGYVLNKQSQSLKKITTEPRYTASRHSHLTRGV
jgi:uncharacterized membrane protein